MELDACHPFGAENIKMASRFIFYFYLFIIFLFF